jgi:hypothetical protein
MNEMVGKRFYKKCLFTIVHALDEVKIRAIVVDYFEVWFLLLIKKIILHLNGGGILEATNVI